MTQKQTQPIHTLTPTDLTQAREAIDAWYEADGNRAMPALVAAFDKPYGMTSFQLVARVRRLLTQYWQVKKVKIGHAGTLDPLATGVLVMCTGKATKCIEQLQAGVKEYYATLKLGATTPSFDLEHPIDATYPTEHITEAEVRRVLSTFKGEIMQVPPTWPEKDRPKPWNSRQNPCASMKLNLLSAISTPRKSPFAWCAQKVPISAPWPATSAWHSEAERTSRPCAVPAWATLPKRTPSIPTASKHCSMK